MYKFILLVLLATLAAIEPLSAKKKSDAVLPYEIEGAGTATQGNYLVRITVMSKKRDVTDAQLKCAAVHGVLFRGFVNNGRTQKPLAGSMANEARHADFYSDFFDKKKGVAHQYGSTLTGSRNYIKVNKDYKVSAVVTVNKDALRKTLEDAGVIKGLNSAF